MKMKMCLKLLRISDMMIFFQTLTDKDYRTEVKMELYNVIKSKTAVKCFKELHLPNMLIEWLMHHTSMYNKKVNRKPSVLTSCIKMQDIFYVTECHVCL